MDVKGLLPVNGESCNIGILLVDMLCVFYGGLTALFMQEVLQQFVCASVKQ